MFRNIAHNWRFHLLLGLMFTGLALTVWQPAELDIVMEWGRRLAGNPLAMLLLVGLMILTFALALPGAAFFWLIAPFHPPLVAVALLLVGSVGGALSAYSVAARLGRRWQPKGLSVAVMTLLQKRSDVFTQCALRILPGFPHAIINYAAGVLRLPRTGFIGAALIGLGIKWSIYTASIHGVMTTLETGALSGARTLLPLVLLSSILLAGAWIRRRLLQAQEEAKI